MKAGYVVFPQHETVVVVRTITRARPVFSVNATHWNESGSTVELLVMFHSGPSFH